MKIKYKSSEVVILLLVSLMSFAANLPSQLVDNVVDRKFLLIVLAASVVIALFHYLRLMLFLAVVILAIGANLPQTFAAEIGINPKILLLVLGLMVVLALLNYAFSLLPTGENEDSRETADLRFELLAVISRGDQAGLIDLLNQDINVNFFAGGITPLHLAAEKGYPAIVKLLVNYGADINAQSSTGQKPIDIALEKRFIRSSEILFNAAKGMGA